MLVDAQVSEVDIIVQSDGIRVTAQQPLKKIPVLLYKK